MKIKNINSNEDFVNWITDYWNRDVMVNSDTGRIHDYFLPQLRASLEALDRFIEAQDKWNTYQTALEEVKAGKKKTHWIWFIFPTLYRSESSEISRYYGLCGRNEAEEYLNNPLLKERLIEITEAVYNNDKTVYEIFGNDAIKVRSCMLLFASVSDIPIFKEMVEKYNWK